MTNREILKAKKETLSSTDRQRQHVLHTEMIQVRCPACQTGVNALEAAGIDVDEYDFGVTRQDYHCPHCEAELELVVPFIAVGPGWHWVLKLTWLQEQLRKAKEFDKLKPNPQEDKSESA